MKNKFFSKLRRSETLNAARPSKLRLETLEERQLLSVTDVASLVFADSIVDDAQYTAATNVDDAVIDVGSVMNTTAGEEVTYFEITQDYVFNHYKSQQGTDFVSEGDGLKFIYSMSGSNIASLTVEITPADDSTLPVVNSATALKFYDFSSALLTLNVPNLSLTALDVSGLASLENLVCNNNNLTTIDFSKNTRLRTLDCQNNQFSSLNITNTNLLRTLKLDYSVDFLFVRRNTFPSIQNIEVTLYNIPSTAPEKVQEVVSIVNNPIQSGTQTSYQITPTTLESGELYAATFNLPRLSLNDIHDPIYAHVTVNNDIHLMKINPMVEPTITVDSVTAVVENGKALGTLDLAYRDIVNNSYNDEEFNFTFTIEDGESIVDVSKSFALGNKEAYENISDIGIGSFNHKRPLIFTGCFDQGGLVPSDDQYTITCTVTSDGVAESFEFNLLVEKAQLETPAVTGEATANTITLTWQSVQYAEGYYVHYEANGQVYTVDVTEETTDPETNLSRYEFTATGLESGTEYTFTVTAHRKYMDDSVPYEISVTTLSPSVVVTIVDDEYDHSNDFDDNGNPLNISLREAYDYVNRYFVGGTLNSSVENADILDNSVWVIVEDENDISFEDGSYFYTDASGKKRSVYKTIEFQNEANPVTLDFPIVSNKTFTINGVTENNGQVIVSGGLSTRIFEINAGTITAENLVLTCGNAENGDGGAVYINPSDGKTAAYVANGGTFESNEATKYGGAIYVGANGTLIVNGATFKENTAIKYGGAVYVGVNGTLIVNESTFKENTATRGGAIANFAVKGSDDNYGVTITGESSFVGNLAIPSAAARTNGSFGGAIYNAGTITIGENISDSPMIGFEGNQAFDKGDPITVPITDGATEETNVAKYLKGYSGGAIYNTTKDGQTGTITAYNVVFTNNFAGKYGGAVSNFGEFVAENVTFSENVASSGGAVQNSGNALFDGCEFEANVALSSVYALDVAGLDFGGNGSAIFSSLNSGSGGILTMTGEMTFSANKAANAGGAISYISGSMTFDGASVSVKNNVAKTFGGGIVIASEVSINSSTFEISGNNIDAVSAPESYYDKIVDEGDEGVVETTVFNDSFHKDPADGQVGFYAPNVAITCDVGDSFINAISTAFFGEAEPGQDKVALFVRYMTKTSGDTLIFDDLAAGIPGNPDQLVVQIDGGTEETWTSGSSAALSAGSTHVVRYYVPVGAGEEKLVYRANICVVGDESAIISQIDLSDLELSGSGIPVGVSIRVHAANPIKTWAVNWDADNAESKPIDYDAYGYAFNIYKFYESEGQYHVTLVTTDDEENVQTYDLGSLVARTPDSNATNSTQDDGDSGAILDFNLFSDADFVDELFEI